MWPASLSLVFEHRSNRTVLARCRHRGPLRVQRPLYPEAACHVYMLHPPGGVVGGDSLDIDVVAEAGAQALVTTPAAGKLYRSDRRWATLTQRCRVEDGAALEWFPHENIVFDNAWANVTTEVELAPGASFSGWDITCLGRPAAAEQFTRGACIQRLIVRRQGELLWMEHNRYEGGAARLQAPWGLGGCSVCATLVCIPARGGGSGTSIADLVSIARSALRGDVVRGDDARDSGMDNGMDDGASDNGTNRAAPAISVDAASAHADMAAAAWGRAGVTALGDIIVCRYLGHEAEHARSALIRVWRALRPYLVGREAVLPRIWAT